MSENVELEWHTGLARRENGNQKEVFLQRHLQKRLLDRHEVLCAGALYLDLERRGAWGDRQLITGGRIAEC